MTDNIKVDIYTMCLVQDGDKVLLLDRPSNKGFPGFIAPGGKLDFPESLTEGAAREVYEETGLRVSNLIYKGLDEFVDVKKNYRYMVFNYLTSTFEGKLYRILLKEHFTGSPFMKQRSYQCSLGSKGDFRCFSRRVLLRFTLCGMRKKKRH